MKGGNPLSNQKESALKLQKKELAKDIAKKLKNAKSLIIAEYRGLSVSEITQLRKEALKQGIDIKVYKNRIFKYAAKDAKIEGLDEHLVGPNLFAFCETDDIAPAKLIAKFAKDFKLLKPKAGIFEGKVIDAKGVADVATLPNYEEALSLLGRSLISPLQQLSIALKMYSEKEEK
ncbi:50S ribosomal protein L10 [Mycoplasma sp. Mirounga ES2805-ORL]|uniref:50S ribosomal protein L10 n=1 Tax=Mycoplasma sp. Mirounga ES2805-ORL TaxID=754514 RepID=UPI00197BCA7F|nr:50S ribosomal protein L10 [Mycoplasma sp. Mirounga ES2805-ORL]QSF13661.1 50S ribosomal protein L10 [Mycoplasma sp. Mirounga ES2805-ORL]